MNVIVLVVVIVSWATDGSTSTFMWVRALILLAATPLLLVLIRKARRGSQAALERVRLVSTVLPVAIVLVDLIPGVCPAWYAAMQAGRGAGSGAGRGAAVASDIATGGSGDLARCVNRSTRGH